jgi:hypothetical protein
MSGGEIDKGGERARLTARPDAEELAPASPIRSTVFSKVPTIEQF